MCQHFHSFIDNLSLSTFLMFARSWKQEVTSASKMKQLNSLGYSLVPRHTQGLPNSLQSACKTWRSSRMLPARVTVATGARAKKALTCAVRVLLKVNPPHTITVPWSVRHRRAGFVCWHSEHSPPWLEDCTVGGHQNWREQWKRRGKGWWGRGKRREVEERWNLTSRRMDLCESEWLCS